MATLQKFKLLATQCAIANSPTRSPAKSPVIHIRRRKTLRMLLNKTADRRRYPRREEISEVTDRSPEKKADGNRKKENRVRRCKLKELFVSSPPIEEDRENNHREESSVASGGGTSSACCTRRSGSLRNVSARFRYRVLRKAWRPVLVPIPE